MLNSAGVSERSLKPIRDTGRMKFRKSLYRRHRFSREMIRRWCIWFGPIYLCRTVDQDSQVLDIVIQKWRNKQAAARFFHGLLKQQSQGSKNARCADSSLCVMAIYS